MRINARPSSRPEKNGDAHYPSAGHNARREPSNVLMRVVGRHALFEFFMNGF